MRLEISVSNHSFFCSLVERESKINQLFQAIASKLLVLVRVWQDSLEAWIAAQRVLR
jgi:hypothetical protein